MDQPSPSTGQPARPPPPAPVLTAVKLMFAGAAVSAVTLIISLAHVPAAYTIPPGWSKRFTGYTAAPGWDPVTGWGTPNAQQLIPLLAHYLSDPAVSSRVPGGMR